MLGKPWCLKAICLLTSNHCCIGIAGAESVWVKYSSYSMLHGIFFLSYGEDCFKKNINIDFNFPSPDPTPKRNLSLWIVSPDNIYVKPWGKTIKQMASLGWENFVPGVSIQGHSSGMWQARSGSGGSRNCPGLFRICVSSSPTFHLQ